MKRILLTLAVMLGFAVAAAAQPKAVGIRFGYGVEASYQHSLGNNFVEANLGLEAFNVLNVAATYNWMIAQPQWTDRGEWGFYAGPGANVGLGMGSEGNNFFNVSAAGAVGIEYTFWFPLQLSFDFRQHLGLGFGGYGFYNLSSACLGIRYRF